MSYQEKNLKNLSQYLIKTSMDDLQNGYFAYMEGRIELAESFFLDCDLRNTILEILLGNQKNESLETEFNYQREQSKCKNSDMELYANNFELHTISECCDFMKNLALNIIDRIFEAHI